MSNTFVIEWIGPFITVEDLKQWEKVNNQNHDFIYIVSGKLKGKRTITNYCGITNSGSKTSHSVYSRFINDQKHKVHDLSRETSIWIGSLIDPKMRTKDNIELCETMIISYWQPEENIRKKAYYPSESVLLVNRWFNTNKKLRTKVKFPAQKLSDIIFYDTLNNGIFGVERMKKLVPIEW